MWRGRAHKLVLQQNKRHTKPGSHLHKWCACLHSYTTYRMHPSLLNPALVLPSIKLSLQGCNSFILCYTHTLSHTQHTHTHTHTCTHTHAHTCTDTHTHVHTHTHTCLKGWFSTLLFALFKYSKWLKITGRCCWAWRPLPQVISVPFLCMQCSLCNASLLSLQYVICML
jgi:hypothetical protein